MRVRILLRMMKPMRLLRPVLSIFAALIGAGALSCALAAAAPLPHLVSALPAKDSHVEWPKQVHLQFSGALDPTSVTVTMIRPSGESIPIAAPIPSADNRAFTAEVKQPTQAGPYMIQWQGAAANGAPVKGDYTFFVQ